MRTGILLSGGMDSTALLFWKKPEYALTINYGQVTAGAEIRSSRQICEILKIEHEIINIDCRSLGSGELTGTDNATIAPVPEWWPFRNQMLITLAGMKGVSKGIGRFLFGAVKTDNEYIDGTNKFFRQIDELMRMQEGNIGISTPALNLSTTELILTSGIELNLLAWTHSCTRFNYACGRCRSCIKHISVMNELGHENFG